MKKFKPNLRAMFNFHTIILMILLVVVSTLRTHTIEGKLQTNLKHHHHHTHNYKQHNNIGGINTDVENVANKLEQQHGHHNHQHSHHHQHQHQHHHHHYQPHQPQYTATPSLEFTTSSLASLSSTAAMNSDNEFLIKQQELPLTNKDEIYYETKDLKSFSTSYSSTSSTTSKPSLSIQLKKQHVGNMKMSSSNTTTTMQSKTLPYSRREHTHLKLYNNNSRLITTPSTKHQTGSSGIDNNRSDIIATMFSAPNKNSKWKLATTKNNDNTKLNQPAEHQNQTHNEHHHRDHKHDQKTKPEFHSEKPAHQNYVDYYSDAEDDNDDDNDNDDDDYNEDEGDNENIDGISYDDDNNLSDRSYARITRSKLDDDYIDDEPYRNGLNELSMQRDAPGVLTEQKYLDVGNEKAVQQARERYIQEQKRPRTPHELATEHWHRMIQATKCRKPLPRVIPVSNNTSKRYEPYATILHRCGDDTGCCGSTGSVCTVKRHEIVMVYVFSYDFNYRKEIEALPMQNHTECHCVNRGSLLHDSMPRDKRSGGSGTSAGGGLGSTTYLHHFQRQQRKQQHQQQHRQSQSQLQQLHSHHQQQLQNMLDCHCPRHFNVLEEDVERHAHLPKPHSVFIRKCRCDCLVNNQTCLRFKHGEEGFSLEDRKCILERNCKPPVCSYGEYNLRVGRCPSYYRSHLLQTT